MSDGEDRSAMTHIPVPLPGLHAPSRGRWTYAQWLDRYGYYVDEMTFALLERLSTRCASTTTHNGGRTAVVHWSPREVRDRIARLCYATSSNAYRRNRPVL